MATRRRASQRSLTGSISDIQRRVKYLQNRQTPTRLGNQSVQRNSIQYRAVGTDQIAPNSIVNDQIQANAIAQAQLSDNSVGRNEIINGEVVEAKLGTDAVTSTKIKDGEVITGKLGSAAVELLNMAPNSVNEPQLITNSVNFRVVAPNAIGNENMLDNSVGQGEIQNDSVGNGELRNDSVGFSELQGSSVGTSTLQTGAVTRSKIGSGQIGTTQIADGAVTGNKIARGTIDTPLIRSTSSVVSAGLSVGAGISKSGATISLNYGNGSAQVARGNHGHGYRYLSRDAQNRPLNTFVNSTTGLWVSLSSQKYKKDISPHVLEDPKRLLELNLKKYKYKNKNKIIHENSNKEWMYGYIAEEVEQLGFKEIVSYNKNNEPEALNYSLLSVLILELVKEQQKEINFLKNKIKENKND